MEFIRYEVQQFKPTIIVLITWIWIGVSVDNSQAQCISGLDVTVQSSTVLLVAWNAPNSGCDADVFEVKYQLHMLEQCMAGDGTSVVVSPYQAYIESMLISGLQPYSTYNVTVTPGKATDLSNFYIPGMSQSHTVTTEEVAPNDSPQNLRVTQRAPRSFGCEWNKLPCGTRGSIITGFSYRVTKSTSGETVQEETTTTPARFLTVSGLEENTMYDIRVSAVNNVGNGPESDTVSATTTSFLFPHGAAEGDTFIPVNDDGGSGEIFLSTFFPFFDTNHDSLFVNTNGVISFLVQVSQYTPMAFPLSGDRRLIAPFWGDVDTNRGGTNSYREIVRTNVLDVIFKEADDIIKNQFVQHTRFSSTWMFVATWDSVGYYGSTSPSIVNTFQAVLLTNGRHSFVIFNYQTINWTTGTASEGDPTTGLGGTPAHAGFNAGDGMRYFSIQGSQTPSVVDIETTTNVGTAGRWVFQVDSATIEDSGCNTAGSLAVYPVLGSMLGGDIVRISGPCFDPGSSIKCKFHDVVVTGELESNNKARCITPTFFSTGRISLELSLDDGNNYDFKGLFTIVSIEQILPKVVRTNPDTWITANQYSITWDTDVFNNILQNVDIEVVGYTEDGGTPELNVIYKINDVNPVDYSSGTHSFSEFEDKGNLTEYRVGFIKVSQASTVRNFRPTVWSDVHSLQWLFDFPTTTCDTWYGNEMGSLNFLSDTSSCPCTLTQALVDAGRFGSHPDCNQVDAPECDDRDDAIHCVRALQPSDSRGGQECCYGADDNILNVDTSSGGGFAHRNHHSGVAPYEAPGIVPYLSHILNDIEPWMQCCVFTNAQSSCNKYREVRPSQICDGYEPPQPAGGGGDPHILTLDGASYTFNGKGEYVMLNADPRANSTEDDFILQARTNTLRDAAARVTVFVAVAAQFGTSDIIHVEVNERRVLDVWVKEQGQDWRYLDFEESTWWNLNGVSVSGRNISERGVLVIFSGGASLELKAEHGIMSILFLGPDTFRDNTVGLLGTWNDNPDDDFLSPTGDTITPNATLEELHNQFGQLWQIAEADSLFYYPQGMSADDFKDESFTPIFAFPMNPDLSDDEVTAACDGNEWCLFDFHATGDMEIAMASRAAYEEQTTVLEASANLVICSSLGNPANGAVVVTRSSVGGVAMYSCDEGYVIMGLNQRVCQEDGTWFDNAPNCTAVIPPASAQVLIVGGGPAGIHAAAALLENDINDFIILEEDSQLRGYLAPIDFGGFTFAPGSMWGHSPILDKLNDQGIAYKVSNYSSIIVRNNAGEIVGTTETLARQQELYDALDVGLSQIGEDIEKGSRPDVSQKVTLARGGWIAANDVDKAIQWFNIDFVYGMSARRISTIGPYRQDGLFTGDYFILDDTTLAGPLLGDQEDLFNDGHVRYDQRAVTVNQTAADSVKIVTEDGTEFTGEYVIVTSTVGVLQHGGVTFDPPIPGWKTEQICRFQMGTIDPIFMKFNSKFWDDEEWILHASDRHGYYPGFLNLEAEGLKPAGTNILVGFLTGDEAFRAELLTDNEVQAEIIEVLRSMYGAENVSDPTEFYMSRFATDPSLYGSFATWPIGNIPKDAQRRLQAHFGRVYFAPEDASDEYITIPFGSVQSGTAAAMSVVGCLQEMSCAEYSPKDPELPPLCRDVKPYNPTKRRRFSPVSGNAK